MLLSFFQKITQSLLRAFQFVLVFLFILFEEIIWEGIALPLYNKVQSLRILQALQTKVLALNRYVILVLFLILLFGVEGAGLLAGVLFVQGKAFLGMVLYVSKIPIAAFTFWLFRVAKERLLSFDWFAWAYDRLMQGIEWLKSREIYQSTLKHLLRTKEKLKALFRRIKIQYFSQESRFVRDLRRFYRYIKIFRNRKEP